MNIPLLISAIAPWLKPLWIVGAGAAVALAVIFVLLQLLKLFLPKLAAITWATAKEAMTQPLFGVLLAIGLAALIIFPFIPYFTFGEDLKMLKDTGLTLIMVLSIVLAIWTASVSVSEEIDGKTALTVLSKPIKRWHFILGKYFGILVPVAIMFVVLGAVFLGTISYKVKYDSRETSQPEPTWEQCQHEMVIITPGLALAFMEAAVIASIGVAISTRLPMLENFNVYGAIATGKEIPMQLLVWSGVYSVVYCTVAMLVALLLFEDRDLA